MTFPDSFQALAWNSDVAGRSKEYILFSVSLVSTGIWEEHKAQGCPVAPSMETGRFLP